MPGKKLTDKQRKKIIADYSINQNYCETARINKVSEFTVRRICKNPDNKEITKVIEDKKNQNTRDVLEYMDSIAEDQKKVLKLSLDALIQKLENPDMFTGVKDIAMVYGVIFDKAVKSEEVKAKLNEDNSKDKKKVVIVNDLPRK